MKWAGFLARLRFRHQQLRERLWVKPLIFSLLSLSVVVVAGLADHFGVRPTAFQVRPESVETLLSIMASSMLVIAVFAVASMVAAYASASTTASPRTFSLVIADDVSQQALSTFVGAFIFSIVGLGAAKQDYFGPGGYLVVFLFALAVFAIVIFTFQHWVDRIARLGRVGEIIDKVENATAEALQRRLESPTLKGATINSLSATGDTVLADTVGYLQRVDMLTLQTCAQASGCRIALAVLPGSFITQGRVLAYVRSDSRSRFNFDPSKIVKAFVVGKQRTFTEDPRFGLVVLSQIAARALSPAVNDPGTAIDIIGVIVRLLFPWRQARDPRQSEIFYDRIEVPEISVADMFDDAFIAIERDGRSAVEVSTRLLKALASLAGLDNQPMRQAARHHAQRVLNYAETALTLAEDLEALQKLSGFTEEPSEAPSSRTEWFHDNDGRPS